MEKVKGGFVLQPRQLDDSPVMREAPVVRELWQYICRKVNWRDTPVCQRGEGFFHFADIQEDLCWYVGYRKMKYSKPQLTKALRRLREGNMIATAKETRGIRVSVLNYNYFQNLENYEGNGEDSAKEMRRKREGNTIPEERKKGITIPPTPLSKKGGEERVIPVGASRKSKAEQKRIRVNHNSPAMVRIGKWFGRSPDTLWTVAEAVSLRDLKPTEEEIERMEKRYTDPSAKFKRKDIYTLLNNWRSELDRCLTIKNNDHSNENGPGFNRNSGTHNSGSGESRGTVLEI